eukprot:GHVL01008121.1.p1 GENE.GHVL01008121.1~~GHVL01008121.1.p1  ORF type:complete len:966 (-),score=145.56 GHVL01008121.1:2750-5647(-)
MGFSGIEKGGASDKECRDFYGSNYCGDPSSKISLTNMACEGAESRLLDCPHSNEEPFCTHLEDVVVQCEGDGDGSGNGGTGSKETPDYAKRPFVKLAGEVSCRSTMLTLKNRLPNNQKWETGSMFIVKCEADCDKANEAMLHGTFIYTEDSSVCRAAAQTGAIGSTGGDVVVVISHGQESYFGSNQNGIVSTSAGTTNVAFSVSRPSSNVLSQSTDHIDEKKKFGGASALFSAFLQISSIDDEPKSSNARPVFSWPQNDFFDGSTCIDTEKMQGAESLKDLQGFTLSVKARLLGGSGAFRNIVDHSSCGGMQLQLDPSNKIIFTQMCNPPSIQTGVTINEGQSFHVAVVYRPNDRSSNSKTVDIWVNNVKVVDSKKVSFDFNFSSHMVIGCSSNDMESDAFDGEINAVRLFDYDIGEANIKAESDYVSSDLVSSGGSPLGPQRRTIDGRVCISSCKTGPPPAITPDSKATNPTIMLTCMDTLTSRQIYGELGSVFRVQCPSGCSDSNEQVYGSSLYTDFSGICKSAIHSGVIQNDGGPASIEISKGLSRYPGAAGNAGVRSISWVETAQPRSFRVLRPSTAKSFQCSDTGGFVREMPKGDRALVMCPQGCVEKDHAVFGSGIHSGDSSVCRSAIFEGVITNSGGEVEIEVVSGLQMYLDGGFKNGVDSKPRGAYVQAFRVVPSTLVKCRSFEGAQMVKNDWIDNEPAEFKSSNSFEIATNSNAVSFLGASTFRATNRICEESTNRTLRLKNFSCDNYVMSTSMLFEGPSQAGVLLKAHSNLDYYLLEAVASSEDGEGQWRLRKFVQGTPYDAWSKNFEFKYGKVYRVRAGVSEGNIHAAVFEEGHPTAVLELPKLEEERSRNNPGGVGLAYCGSAPSNEAGANAVVFGGVSIQSVGNSASKQLHDHPNYSSCKKTVPESLRSELCEKYNSTNLKDCKKDVSTFCGDCCNNQLKDADSVFKVSPLY